MLFSLALFLSQRRGCYGQVIHEDDPEGRLNFLECGERVLSSLVVSDQGAEGGMVMGTTRLTRRDC